MKIKKLAVFLLSVASVFAMTFGGISVYQTVKAEETKVDNVIAQMESEYKVGTSIEIPDAYFENGGNRVKANKTVIYPNGSQYRVNRFTPDSMGSYAVE